MLLVIKIYCLSLGNIFIPVVTLLYWCQQQSPGDSKEDEACILPESKIISYLIKYKHSA